MVKTTLKTGICKRHYKSDFAVIFKLSQNGEDISWPSVDFSVTFLSEFGRKYTCSRVGDTCDHCKVNGDGSLTCYLDSHNLGVGPLEAEIAFSWPDANYEDSVRLEVSKVKIGLLLVNGSGCGDDIVVEVGTTTTIVDIYQNAVSHGYTGTQDEFYKALSDLPSFVFLTETAYDALVEAGTTNSETVYLTYEDEEESTEETDSEAEE